MGDEATGTSWRYEKAFAAKDLTDEQLGIRTVHFPYTVRELKQDVYDALVTTRSYKPALPPAEAITILRRETDGGSWDPRVLAAFLDVLKEAPGSH